ncbi:hypothetical protein C3Y94_025840 [Rhizobium ruizarguesonis]|uniref:DUF6197 family protein n=1 Tax=Rhizobium ruizarguesonis TaxID=2081791 RepID=UPI00163A5CBB|nr:hypothetical protein [Rhizobium ruizarguesonis]MBC2806576.1 hypothetical protein [Rhizobium ruizarguesonis]
MQTPLEILTAAQELIRDPVRWTRETYAREPGGECVEPNDKDACSWCSIGAIQHVLGSNSDLAEHPTFTLLQRAANCSSVPDYNDNDDHTHVDIMTMFDQAKELARVETAGA